MDENNIMQASKDEIDKGNQSTQAELEVQENKIRIISPGRMVLKRFFRSKLSVIGLMMLICLFAFSFLGPLFSSWGEKQPDDTQGTVSKMDYESFYTEKLTDFGNITYCIQKQLGQVSVTKDNYKAYLQTIYQNLKGGHSSFKDDAGEDVYFQVDKVNGEYVVFLGSVDENDVFTRNYRRLVQRTVSARDRNLNASPSARHWLGTDGNGYDVFTRLMYGGRISLTLGFVVIFIEMLLGILFGGLAGYFGKWVDNIIMRVIDVLYCLPSMPILLIFSAILDGDAFNIPEGAKIYFLMGMLSIIGWAGIARTVRGQILYLREQEYMVAAEALGLGVPRRIVRHLIPNVMPLLIVSATMGLGGIILTEASLSFLGLGIKPPAAAWGTMINTANEPSVLQFFPNQWIPAGIMIILAVLGFNFVGDGLRDAFDPKMKR